MSNNEQDNKNADLSKDNLEQDTAEKVAPDNETRVDAIVKAADNAKEDSGPKVLDLENAGRYALTVDSVDDSDDDTLADVTDISLALEAPVDDSAPADVTVESANDLDNADDLGRASETAKHEPDTENTVEESPSRALHENDTEDERAFSERAHAKENSIFRSYPLYALEDVRLPGTGEDISFACQGGRSYALLVDEDASDFRTNLLGVMACMAIPEHGKVMSKGSPLAELDGLQIRGQRLALMMRQFAFRPDLNAVDNLLYAMGASNVNFLKPKGVVAADSLKAVNFGSSLEEKEQENLRKAPAGTLPVLEQQRLSLARAICRDPDIIIADEPTYDLSTSDAKEFLSQLKEHKQTDTKERVIIVVTSNPEVANSMEECIKL